MSRKAKREIAKARQRNASSRVADKWTMQRMAVDLSEKDAEIEKLRSLLGCALSEHDGNSGQFTEGFMPHHWTHQARRLLTAGKSEP